MLYFSFIKALLWGGADPHHGRRERREAGLPLLRNIVALVENDPVLRGERQRHAERERGGALILIGAGKFV